MSIRRNTPLYAAVITALALSAAPSLAQDLPPATMTLVAEDGTELEYSAGDASFYVSTSAGYEGSDATTDTSLSLSTITPVDADLLKWAAQTGSKSKEDYAIVITSTITDAEGAEHEIRYEIEGATVNSFSTSVSTYAAPSVSVSLTGGKLVIDGVAVN